MAVSDIAFTATVKAAQESRGSRSIYSRMEEGEGWHDRVTPRLAEFIAARDSFYLGTASSDGRPYIQHRGGPTGFLKILDEHTLAFADFAGNRQYISIGNLDENPQAFIFLMDYANRGRIKVWGTARFVEDDEELLARLVEPGYRAKPERARPLPSKPERALVFTIEAWDGNCRQHITPRYTRQEWEAMAAEEGKRQTT